MFTGISIWTIAGLLLGSAALLAVLHRLRIRPQTVWVNTTLFWDQALRRTRARSLWERFRHPLTYLLLLLIAALLISALGDPRPARDATDQEYTVFVLDLGSSMSAPADGSQTRLDLAKAKLSALVNQFAWPDGFAVVTAGEEPSLIHAMGDLRPMLEHRLETVSAASMPTDREHAVQLATSLLAGRQNPSVCLITDRPFEATKNTTDETASACKVVQVGTPVSNAAILSAIFEPDQKNPLVGTLQVRAGIWPKGKATVKITARREGGPVLAEKETTITESKEKSESIVELAVEQLAADGGTVKVEITGDDALKADSVVRYQLPVRRPIRVLIDNDLPNWLAVLMDLDPTLVRSESSDANVKLQVAATEPLEKPCRVVEASIGNAETVSFEDLYCDAGIPRDHFDNSITPLVTVGDDILVASQPTAPCPTLWLADATWKDDAAVIRSAAWPLVISRAIRELADWKTAPMSLSPMVARQMSEVDEKALATMPGGHTAGNLTTVEESETESNASSIFATGSAWTEWLLLAALVLAAVEIILHTKGRIA